MLLSAPGLAAYIHKSSETQRWLKENPTFRGIYQPVYRHGWITLNGYDRRFTTR
jgi:hypothetical protein